MNVLVTGGRGFIGRFVTARLLADGHRVRVLARPDSSTPDPAEIAGSEVIRHDLTVREGLTSALEDMDAVVHAAAAMGGTAEEQESVTVDGTTHLLSAMGEAGVRKIVLLSTFAVYDYAAIARNTALTEDSPLEEDFDARSPYVWTKRKQEDLVRAVAEGSHWTWTILRPGVVYGPGRTWFYHLGVQPRPNRWVSYAGGALFPVTYVENCADAVVRALTSDGAKGKVLNIVDDGLPTRRLYLETLARLTGRNPTILDVPWDFLSPVSEATTWLDRRVFLRRLPMPDLLKAPRLQARCKPLAYSNEHAKSVLGWEPRFSFEQGMTRSFPDAG